MRKKIGGHKEIGGCKKIGGYGFRGSFTVEAAFLYPVIVLLIAFILYLSMSWYQNVRTAAEDTEELRELDMRSYFLDNVGQVLSRGLGKAED